MAKTKSGFSYTLPEGLADDFEYLEAVEEAQQKPLGFIKVAKYLLGEEGYTRLKEHCRVDGKVSTKRIVEEITEISNDDSQLKK